MEAFSLLKYWRGGGGAAVVSAAPNARSSATATTTIATSALRSAAETDDDSDDGNDEGPFFDLEFAVPDEECEGDSNEEDDRESSRGGEEREEKEEEEEREFNFTVSSEGSCSGLRTDPNLSLSPSDDLFFKGRLVPLEPSSLVFNPSEANSRPHILPVSLLKSATKLRVFMLGFKKPKSSTAAAGDLSGGATATTAPSPKHQQQHQSKFFTVKFKVDEVPIVSLFTRDSSSRSSGSNNGRQPKQQAEDGGAAASTEDKKFSKELMQKYLSKIKPLYVRVSKRYGEKLRFSGQLSSVGVVAKSSPGTSSGSNDGEAEGGEAEAVAAAAPAAASSGSANKSGQKQPQVGNLPAGLRVVCKHLGKSRSASSAVAAVPSPAVARRQDDSLLQQQDGIQSAIAHCKRSFNASKDVDSPLLRSKSDSCDERSVEPSKTCAEKVREDCV